MSDHDLIHQLLPEPVLLQRANSIGAHFCLIAADARGGILKVDPEVLVPPDGHVLALYPHGVAEPARLVVRCLGLVTLPLATAGPHIGVEWIAVAASKSYQQLADALSMLGVKVYLQDQHQHIDANSELIYEPNSQQIRLTRVEEGHTRHLTQDFDSSEAFELAPEQSSLFIETQPADQQLDWRATLTTLKASEPTYEENALNTHPSEATHFEVPSLQPSPQLRMPSPAPQLRVPRLDDEGFSAPGPHRARTMNTADATQHHHATTSVFGERRETEPDAATQSTGTGEQFRRGPASGHTLNEDTGLVTRPWDEAPEQDAVVLRARTPVAQASKDTGPEGPHGQPAVVRVSESRDPQAPLSAPHRRGTQKSTVIDRRVDRPMRLSERAARAQGPLAEPTERLGRRQPPEYERTPELGYIRVGKVIKKVLYDRVGQRSCSFLITTTRDLSTHKQVSLELPGDPVLDRRIRLDGRIMSIYGTGTVDCWRVHVEFPRPAERSDYHRLVQYWSTLSRRG